MRHLSQCMGLHYRCIFHPWPDPVSLKLTLVSFSGYDFLDIYSRTLQTMRSLMQPQHRDHAQVPAFSVHTPLCLLQQPPPERIEQLKLKVPLPTSSMIADFYVWGIKASGRHLFNKEATLYMYMVLIVSLLPIKTCFIPFVNNVYLIPLFFSIIFIVSNFLTF